MNRYLNPDQDTIIKICQRPAMDVSSLQGTIDLVFSSITSMGDEALIDFTEKFDKIRLESLFVADSEITGAINSVPESLKKSIAHAYDNIRKFHEMQQSELVKVETTTGVTCWQKSVAIDKVGLYIPGGTAPLFSTVLMLAIPAQIAGCEEIVLCTPPDTYGNINPVILYTAQLCGVTTIIKAGGAQAIAAMSIGTESVTKVDKIFGPGNQYVTAAKMKAFQSGTAIDMPAGPSEVLVFADVSGQPDFIASDLLSQAEHGVDSQVIFVTTDESLLDKVEASITSQIALLPRQEIAQFALENSHMILMGDTASAFDFINEYAPEHFIISSDKSESYIDLIKNAGSVFLGNYTPESAGDYASGTNHTLPTNGHAKAFSGVNLDSFCKKITFQHITQEGLKELGNTIIDMAEAEQLQAHANAVKIRIND